MAVLAIFRGSSRKEYADQNIKLLRAVEGEETHSSYRQIWIAGDGIDLCEPGTIAYAILIDEQCTRALPVRSLLIKDVEADDTSVHFTYEVGPWLCSGQLLSEDLALYGPHRPPGKFVTSWKDDWPDVREVSARDDPELVRRVWRSAIDLLVRGWPDRFSRTVFFRLVEPSPSGLPRQPQVEADVGRDLQLMLDSYNPHLADTRIDGLTVRARSTGGVAVRPSHLRVSRDGLMPFEVTAPYADPDAEVRFDVDPDPMFSTYIPLRIAVRSSPGYVSPPRFPTGEQWLKLLRRIDNLLGEDHPELYATVIDALRDTFPRDRTLLLHRAWRFFDRHQWRDAADCFQDLVNHDGGHQEAIVGLRLCQLVLGVDVDEDAILNELPFDDEGRLWKRLLSIVPHLRPAVATRLAQAVVGAGALSEVRERDLLTELVPRIDRPAVLRAGLERLRGLDPERAGRLALEAVRDRSATELDEHGVALAEIAMDAPGGDRGQVLVRLLSWQHQSQLTDADAQRLDSVFQQVRRAGGLRPEEIIQVVDTNLRALDEKSELQRWFGLNWSLTAADLAIDAFHDPYLADHFAARARHLADDPSDDRIRSMEDRTTACGQEFRVHHLLEADDKELAEWVKRRVAGSTLLIFGGPYVQPHDKERLESLLGVTVVWYPADECKRRLADLTRRDPGQTIVAHLYSYSGHLPELDSWCRTSGVRWVRVSSARAIIRELHGSLSSEADAAG